MPRIESQAVAGYFPTPPHLIGRIAALIDAQAARSKVYDPRRNGRFYPRYALLDPCAGDGAALLAYSAALFGNPYPAVGLGATIQLYAAELEGGRARALYSQLKLHKPPTGSCVMQHSDAFSLTWATDATHQGIDLLILNPPYDFDPIYGRLEHAFLCRFTPSLTPGTGLLLYVIPYTKLATSATYLAQEYEAIQAYRLPDEDFAEFKQIVLIARRRVSPETMPDATAAVADQIHAWSEDADLLPVLPLPSLGRPQLALPAGAEGGLLEFHSHALDLGRLLLYHRPGCSGAIDCTVPPADPLPHGRSRSRTNQLVPASELGLDRPVTDFLTQVQEVAMPAKPAHLATLLASGMLNGLRCEPDAPNSGWPALLIKGRFAKELATAKENTDKKGNVVSAVQIEQPVLRVTVLTLTDKPCYYDLAAGTTPSTATTVDKMNIADLLLHYGKGLAALITQQFPAMHDPTAADALIPLPSLGRPLFTAQYHVVQTVLKLLGRGHNPFILGEVGTGKSFQALAVAACFGPSAFATTMAALQRLGFVDPQHRLQPLTALLVLCPPHLTGSWVEQVTLNLPGAYTVVIESVADLRQPLLPAKEGPGAGITVYILSREKAKLGPGTVAALVQGPTGANRCPRCGQVVSVPVGEIVGLHLHCKNVVTRTRTPLSNVARLLAMLLGTTFGHESAVRDLVPARLLYQRHQAALPAAPTTDSPAAETLAADDSPAPAEDSVSAGPDDTSLVSEVASSAPATYWTTPSGRLLWQRLIATLVHEVCRCYQQECARQAHNVLAEDAENNPPPVDIPLLLHTVLLMHLALPEELRAALITASAHALYSASLSQPESKSLGADLRDTVAQLLLLLVPEHSAQVMPLQADLQARGLAELPLWQHVTTATTRLQQGSPANDAPVTDPWTKLTIAPEGRLVWTIDANHYHSQASAHTARAAFTHLRTLADFVWQYCNEPLYQNTVPRRYPIAQYIARRCPTQFQLVLLDEVHEFNNVGSAQERAAGLLAHLGHTPVIALTGSLMGGYASALFANFRSLCAPFAQEFDRYAKGRFVRRYGYLKVLRIFKEKGGRPDILAYGAQSLRREEEEDETIRQLGEAPGVSPAFLPDYLLRYAAIIHKTDLDCELPPLHEQPLPLAIAVDDRTGQALLTGFRELQETLLAQMKADRFTKRNGSLLGALAELPSYLDQATADVGNSIGADGRPVYEIRYAAQAKVAAGELVANATLLPAHLILPKERWLLDQLRSELRQERYVLIYLRHTGNPRLIARYQRLIRQEVGVEAVYLDSSKVSTKVREDWIRREVIGRRRQVLLVNPEAVKTGLNCLVRYFKTAIWMELNYNVLTYRQANGRIHRIGADPSQPVQVWVPVYAGTAQEVALRLIARKLTVSTQMDGLDIESQLEAAGAGGENAEQARSVISMGQAIYDVLTGRQVQVNSFIPAPLLVPTAVQRIIPAQLYNALPIPPNPAMGTQLPLALLTSGAVPPVVGSPAPEAGQLVQLPSGLHSRDIPTAAIPTDNTLPLSLLATVKRTSSKRQKSPYQQTTLFDVDAA